MLHKETFRFLSNIKDNNHKEWMDAHRNAYEAAKKDFLQLVTEVLLSFSAEDPSIAHNTAAKCIFRFNRDIRFSKDKSPYKTNFGASINKTGKNGMTAGYYLHLEPGKSFCGGGLWMPQSKELAAVRQEIDYNWETFRNIVENAPFITTTGGLSFEPEYTLIREPKGYDKNNPAIKYLKLKSFICLKPLTDKAFLSDGIIPAIQHIFHEMHPLLDFMNRAIED